jgi:hypothetical protein
MSRKNVVSLILVVLLMVVGVYAFHFGFHVAVKEEESRRPAALPRVFEESEMKSSDALGAIHDQLLTPAESFSINGSTGVRLGHFEVRGTSGLPVSACQIYNHLELTFVADDMAVGGELPRMVVEGPCSKSGDGTTLSPLSIQFERIYKEPVTNHTMQTFDDPDVSATFVNVSDSWPHKWVLNRVRLYDPAAGPTGNANAVIIEQAEIRDRLGKNLSLVDQ